MVPLFTYPPIQLYHIRRVATPLPVGDHPLQFFPLLLSATKGPSYKSYCTPPPPTSVVRSVF